MKKNIYVKKNIFLTIKNRCDEKSNVYSSTRHNWIKLTEKVNEQQCNFEFHLIFIIIRIVGFLIQGAAI